MFTTRSSFDLTRPKLIFYLFLALAFIGKASGVPHKEFGCEFSDENYNMIQYPKGTPVWSDVKMDSITFDKVEDIKEQLKTLFSEPSIMNELSMFTEFVENCKNDSNVQKAWFPAKHFENFFNSYEVPFEPSEKYDYDFQNRPRRIFREPASYLIQELHALIRNLTLKEKSISPYIVSAYVDPIDVTFNSNSMSYQIPKNISNSLLRPAQDHLAAIINIKSGSRTGYILIDPGYSNGIRVYPSFVAFIMKDRKAPHEEFIRENKPITFAFGDENGNPFILAKHNHEVITMHSLYYVGKPYCSFKENTIKTMLLRQHHGIISRNDQGQKQAYLRFKITPSAKQFYKIHFHLNETSDPKTITPTSELTSSIANLLDISDSQRDIIVNQLISIQRNVFWDRLFLQWLTGLTKRFGLEREPEPVDVQDFDAEDANKKKTKNNSKLSQKIQKLFNNSCFRGHNDQRGTKTKSTD